MNDIFLHLTSADGTATRRDFWIAAAALTGAAIVAGMVPVTGPLVSLLLLYPWTCLSMRRLRDMGRSPRLALLPVFLCSVVGLLTGVTLFGAHDPAQAAVTFLLAGVTLVTATAATLVTLPFLLWIGLTPGRSDAPAASWSQTRG